MLLNVHGGEMGRESERLDRGNRPKKTGETVDRRQNNGVLRRCPLAIAQRLVHCATAVSTAVLGQSHKDNVRCTAVDEQRGQLEAKEVPQQRLVSQLARFARNASSTSGTNVACSHRLRNKTKKMAGNS